MNNTLLLEICTEEMPYKELRYIAEELAKNIIILFDEEHIKYGVVKWFATSRRVAVKIYKINDYQSDKIIEKRGPSILNAFDLYFNPKKNAYFWSRSCGIKLEESEVFINSKGGWLVYRKVLKGHKVEEMLIGIINRAINKNDKIRLLYNVTILLGKKKILGIVLGIYTKSIIIGHRFLGPAGIIIYDAQKYTKLLFNKGYVLVDYTKRKEKIYWDAKISVNHIGEYVYIDLKILEYINSLIEWPVVMIGRFNKKYLILPSEYIIYILKKNNFFYILNNKGKIVPHYILVINIIPKKPKQILLGYERNISIRLSEFIYFLKIDCKNKLEDLLLRLDKVQFHEHLGTMLEKSYRMQLLAGFIAYNIGGNVKLAQRAGIISKCDIMTNIVIEYPEMQGIIGMYYAIYSGESEEVALAQKEQYYPRFNGDKLPTNLVSISVALSDKLDNITGILGMYNIKGDNDPFALRRAALGILRIIVEKKIKIDLKYIIEKSIDLYSSKLIKEKVYSKIINFIMNRFISWYNEKGYKLDIIQAIFSIFPTSPVDFDLRVSALNKFIKFNKKFICYLVTTNKRISKILDKNNLFIYFKVKYYLLYYNVEKKIFKKIFELHKKININININYNQLILEFVKISYLVNFFFERVIVMTKDIDIRINRITILYKLRYLFMLLADLSFLQC